MTRIIACIACVGIIVGIAATALADDTANAVALLPLDADKRLELYGQPVASEIARALVAGNVDVVVVGSKMAVPAQARVIIDGTITGKGGSVILTMRMRNPVDGTVLLTLSATAATLATIDKAAADLSARALPAVREQLVALRKISAERVRGPELRPTAPAMAATPRPVLVSVLAPAGGTLAPLQAALADEVTSWARAHARTALATGPGRLVPRLAVGTVAASGTDLAIAFELAAYTVTTAEIPLARARVRVRITSATAILFDRVVITDSVVGDRGITPADLAVRTAREILEILRPHLRREVASWR